MILIKTFDGFSMASSDYISTATSAKTPANAKPVFIDQAESEALYSGTFILDTRSVVVTVRIIDQANMERLESELKEALKPGAYGVLVGTFTDENRDYQLNCVVQSIHPSSKYEGLYTVIFQTGESAWRTVDEVSDTWEVTASGDSKVISVGGYSRTRLSLQVTPTATPITGWAYQCLYQLVNAVGINHGLRPWAITLDTTAMVAAGKLQADCDDILVFVKGREVKRWIANPNSSTTKIWINLNLAAGQVLTLKTPIASSGAITNIEFVENDKNLTALKALPSRGYLYHGTEWFEYKGRDAEGDSLTQITRGALGTTMQAHSEGDDFYWIENDIMLVYGNSAYTSPALDDAKYDDTKPVFDLSSSTNTSWVYSSTSKFYDRLKPNRTGMWKPSKTRVGNITKIFHEENDVEGGDPVMGFWMSTWYRSGAIAAEKAEMAWTFKHPGGHQTVSIVGSKFRNTSRWPGTSAIKFQRSSDGVTWYEVWNEATPASANAWSDFTHNSVAISSNMTWIRMIFTGSLPAVANVDCAAEVDTATVNFVSANQPVGTLGTEKLTFLMRVTISNTTTDEYLKILFPMLIDVSMVLDGENYLVTYGGVEAANALTLNDDSRDVWINLQPGNNTFKNLVLKYNANDRCAIMV